LVVASDTSRACSAPIVGDDVAGGGHHGLLPIGGFDLGDSPDLTVCQVHPPPR